MPLEFNDLLGKPFPKLVKKELESRRSLSQSYENLPTFRKPYFTIQRIKRLKGQKEFDIDEKETDLKFWKLENYKNFGLSDIEKKLQSGGSLRAPVGITNINIELRDYTFHEVTIEFMVPDITDWEQFKNTWLLIGAPVRYEFGRKSLVEIDSDEDDVRADKEIREGIIADFSWQTGDTLRTITGSITIYSSLFIELSNKAHPKEKEKDHMISFFKNMMSDLYYDVGDLNKSKIIGFYNTINVTPSGVEAPSSDYEIGRRFLDRNKYFYSVITKTRFEELKNIHANTIKASKSGTSATNPTAMNLLRKRYTDGESDISIPFGTDIIEGDLNQFENATGITSPSEPKPSERLVENFQNGVDFIKNNTPFKIENDQFVPNNDNPTYTSWASHKRGMGEFPIIEKRAPNYLKNDVNKDFEKYAISMNAYKRRVEDISKSKKENFLYSTSLQKILIADMDISSSDAMGLLDDSLINDNYFYVSMGFIQKMVNNFLMEKYNSAFEDLMSKYLFEDTMIRDLSFLGLGSSEPDRVIINPWGRKHSKNYKKQPNDVGEKEVDINIYEKPDASFKGNTLDPVNKYYKYDPNGEFSLLEDIFISAVTVLEIANNSNSIMSFVEGIIREIEATTKGLIQLNRIGDTRISKNIYHSNYIRYFSGVSIEYNSKSEDYYTFSLYDPKEKIRSINVNSSLEDAFDELAYYQSRGLVGNGSRVSTMMVHNGVYYNPDGSPNNDFDPFQNIKDKYVSYSPYELNFEALKENDEFSDLTSEQQEFIQNQVARIEKESSMVMNNKRENVLNVVRSTRERIEKFYQNGQLKNEPYRLSKVSLFLTYIKMFFTTSVEVYQNTYNNRYGDYGSATIPIKVDITLDGIAGIVTGNAFKIDLKSFPMAYNSENTSPLFVVSTLAHSFTGGNDWETTIGGFLFIPSIVFDDYIKSTDKLKEKMDSNNLSLKIIRDVIIKEISDIMSKELVK